MKRYMLPKVLQCTSDERREFALEMGLTKKAADRTYQRTKKKIEEWLANGAGGAVVFGGAGKVGEE